MTWGTFWESLINSRQLANVARFGEFPLPINETAPNRIEA